MTEVNLNKAELQGHGLLTDAFRENILAARTHAAEKLGLELELLSFESATVATGTLAPKGIVLRDNSGQRGTVLVTFVRGIPKYASRT